MAKEDEKSDSDDENPFENLPSDLAYTAPPAKKRTATKTVAKTADKTAAMAGTEVTYDDDLIDLAPVSKSTLALVSGLGFVIIAVILYFVFNMYSDMDTIILTILGLFFSALIAFFYLLDELTIRPSWMTSRGGHFISGMFLGALALLIVVILNSYSDWLFLFPLFLVLILMNVSVAFFLYSMAWEE
jgi:hypothetical protein